MGTASKAQHTWPRSLFVLHFSCFDMAVFMCTALWTVKQCLYFNTSMWVSSMCTWFNTNQEISSFLICAAEHNCVQLSLWTCFTPRLWDFSFQAILTTVCELFILLCLQCLIKCVRSWPYIGINHLCHEQCILCTNLKWDRSSSPWTVEGQSWYADVDILFVCCGAA